MFCIVNDGELIRMSAIIGICGENFCSFVADTRLTENFGASYRIINNETDKIFKINDRVLFGMTGLFGKDESILAPLDVYPDKSVITLPMAYKAVLDYIEKNKYVIPQMRNYLVGGKDNKGRFCIYEIHVNFETYKVETTLRMPEPPTHDFGISCCLPPKLYSRKSEFLDKTGKCIVSSKEHNEMLQKVAGIIGEIADVDDTVGKKVSALSIL